MFGVRLVCLGLLITLVCATSASSQSLVSVQPDSGKRGGYLPVTITGQGTHFQASSGTIIVQFNQNSSTMYMDGIIQSLTQLRGNLYISNSAPLGLWDVVVNDHIDPVMTLPQAFRVYIDTSPVLNSVSPPSGYQGSPIALTLTCAYTNFVPETSCSVSLTQGDSAIIAMSASAQSGTTILANFEIPFWASGVWSARIEYPGLPPLTRASCFTINPPPPRIVSVDPDTVFAGSLIFLTIDVENMSLDTNTAFLWVSLWNGMQSSVSGLIPVTPTRLQGNYPVNLQLQPDDYDVIIDLPGSNDVVLPDGMTVLHDPTPNLRIVKPASAHAGDTVTVLFAGANNHFVATPEIISFNHDSSWIYPHSMEVYSSDSMRATFAIADDAFVGYWDIVVNSPTLAPVVHSDKFQIFGQAAITSLDPAECAVGTAASLIAHCQNVDLLLSNPSLPVVFTHGIDTIRTLGVVLASTGLWLPTVSLANAAVGYWDISVEYLPTKFMALENALRVYSTCGDLDGSLQTDISDPVALINYIFAGGPVPLDRFSGDVDCSSRVDIGDAVFLLNYIFASGPAPCETCR